MAADVTRDATRAAYRPDIQGLRAVAVVTVVLYHAGVPGLGGGFLGVDVFFVISGYLIGGPLIATLLAGRRVDLPAFYARRVRRILPASLAVIAATAVASVVIAAPVRVPEILVDGLWSALSAANLRFAVQQTDYLAGSTPSPFQHFWSLGVEEQFYLVAPLLLIAVFALVRRSGRALLAAGLVLAAGSLVLCLVLGDAPWGFFSLATRAWELAAGALAAALVARLTARQAMDVAPTPRAWPIAVGVVGLAAVAAGFVVASLPGAEHPGPVTLLPVVGTALLLIAGGLGARNPVARVLSLRPLVAVGTLSYALYLVHWPLLALPRERFGDAVTPLVTALLVAAAVPLALLLHRTVELPVLRPRRPRPHHARPRRTIAVGAAVTAALSVVLLGSAPAIASIPISAGRPAPVEALAPLPDGTPYVPSNMTPALGAAAADTGALYEQGCQQDKLTAALIVCSFGPDDGVPVVLFGDSHAGRWFPALEAAFAGEGVRLITLTKSGCRSIESAKMWAAAENTSCASWRGDALAWLAQHPPALLVLANHVAQAPDRSAAHQQDVWRGATVSTIARFDPDVRVAVLAETPQFAFSPPVCLSTHVDDALACSATRDEALNAPVIAGQRDGAAEAGAAYVDLSDWFCGARVCPTVIGATLAYTDEHHLSATFSARLAAPVRAALLPLL